MASVPPYISGKSGKDKKALQVEPPHSMHAGYTHVPYVGTKMSVGTMIFITNV